ncbi:MAG: 4-(cytidine 5'-diphospho)-2-C-methyl-D-erythritol kinase [SAR202 cluster bacterium]|jgi:4-diphosphocytidyl-2-C-methyl-D-erythritol kinase|nr:MAG: 4-(cytidine 5'-diphospho)-2-C-methyl-D-erythritol kinase [SAR202 cluster bacterium]MQG75618.1 4-(cytidine 5'-diphospho)-2-C-methyl-D-erythritol kinase [SAR202 cluster bacterium]
MSQKLKPRSLSKKAFGKINLTLEITARRTDGFHEINSVMQTISLCDTVSVTPNTELIIQQGGYVLPPESDLVMQAAVLLKSHASVSQGATIKVDKKIPMSGGLGGGSSDAASALHILCTLWNIPLATPAISELASSIGSDVPFFLQGGTAFVQGRGEMVRAMSPIPKTWFVLCVPDIDVPNKTASMYSLLGPSNFTSGGLSRKIEARVNGGGDLPEEFLFNAFDSVVIKKYERVASAFEAMKSVGIKDPHLVGSGPTVYGTASSKDSARAMQLLLQLKHGYEAYVAEPMFDQEVPK